MRQAKGVDRLTRHLHTSVATFLHVVRRPESGPCCACGGPSLPSVRGRESLALPCDGIKCVDAGRGRIHQASRTSKLERQALRRRPILCAAEPIVARCLCDRQAIHARSRCAYHRCAHRLAPSAHSPDIQAVQGRVPAVLRRDVWRWPVAHMVRSGPQPSGPCDCRTGSIALRVSTRAHPAASAACADAGHPFEPFRERGLYLQSRGPASTYTRSRLHAERAGSKHGSRARTLCEAPSRAPGTVGTRARCACECHPGL